MDSVIAEGKTIPQKEFDPVPIDGFHLPTGFQRKVGTSTSKKALKHMKNVKLFVIT